MTGSSFRDTLAGIVWEGRFVGRETASELIDALMPAIAAEVERRVQAAAGQRAAEELHSVRSDFRSLADDTACGRGSWRAAEEYLAHHPALAQPAAATDEAGRLCLCGKPESDSVHHRPQTSNEEHLYEPSPTEDEFYGGTR